MSTTVLELSERDATLVSVISDDAEIKEKQIELMKLHLTLTKLL